MSVNINENKNIDYSESRVLIVRLEEIRKNRLENFNFLLQEIDSLLNQIPISLNIITAESLELTDNKYDNLLLVKISRVLDSNSHNWLKSFFKYTKVKDKNDSKKSQIYWAINSDLIQQEKQIGDIKYSGYQFLADLDKYSKSKEYNLPKYPTNVKVETVNNSTSENKSTPTKCYYENETCVNTPTKTKNIKHNDKIVSVASCVIH